MKTPFPEMILSQHTAVLGKTRSGKSSVMRLLVEWLMDRNERVCIVDPKGDWHGLRSSADGKKAGYPVVIFGGSRADVPLNAHAGASVAELVASGNRPCVIDLGGWMVGERTRFFIDFASTLFRSITQPLHLVIDECHNFAPQGKILDPDAGKMLHWSNRLASEGAGKGLVLITASQRPQKVHKDFLTCMETLIAMRVIHPLDRGAIKDWIDGCDDPQKGKDVLATLASMARGEGWVWSPEAGIGPERIKFPMFKTYDSFAAPVAGKASTPLKGWAEVDLEDVKAKLAAVVEEAKENDPKELKRQVADLQKHLKACKPTVDDAAISRAVAERDRHWKSELAKVEKSRQSLVSKMSQIERLAHLNGEAVVSVAEPPSIQPGRTQEGGVVSKPSIVQRPVKLSSGRSCPDGGLRRMMVALAQRPQGMSAKQLGVRASLSSSSGTFGTYLGKGRSLGWLDGERNHLRITPDGIAALGDYDPLPVGEALQTYWLNELGGGAARMLEKLIGEYPNSMTADELGEAAEMSAGSGTFGTYLGKLRTLQLVEGGRRALRASDELF